MHAPRYPITSRVRRSAVLFATAVSAWGCGSSEPKPGLTVSSASCDGQPRQPLNCDSEVQYQAIDVKGGFSVLGVNASGGVEQKALRQIDDQTALYVVEARRLCDEYNKCVLDRDAYATRSENLRRRIAKVPELLDGVKSAPDGEARRVALAKAYRELVPGEARTELRLDFSALAQRPTESTMTPVLPGASIPTGSHIAMEVLVSRPAYIYLFEKSAKGSLDVLFPDPRIAVTNPVPPGVSLRIPQGAASFKLDDKDLGTESVFMVASLRPVDQLAAAVASAKEGQPLSSGRPSNGVAQVAALDPSCRSRGLSLDEQASAPPAGCVRSRGLTLDDPGSSTGSRSSLSTATEAADDTIATVFRFDHVHQ